VPINHDPLNFPKSMQSPSEAVVVITSSHIARAIAASRESPRRRIIVPLHRTSADPLQRMLNILQPGSYIQPHRHANPSRAESLVVLSGAICYVTFNESGEVADQYMLAAQSQQIGVDTEGGVYHTFYSLESDTVLFEVKPGPYSPEADKEFAPWAPAEGSEDAGRYLEELSQSPRAPKRGAQIAQQSGGH